MSLKTPYFPAQSGKIRTESGVYWGLKGVKSMIEVIYKEETDNTKEIADCVKLPNNVRQIGEIKGQKKIYMEDYVYTFLKKIARNPHGDEVAAILFGSCHWTSQGDYIFIRSALQIRDLELSPEHIRYDDKVWGKTAKNISRSRRSSAGLLDFPDLTWRSPKRSERRIWIILQEMTKCCF